MKAVQTRCPQKAPAVSRQGPLRLKPVTWLATRKRRDLRRIARRRRKTALGRDVGENSIATRWCRPTDL